MKKNKKGRIVLTKTNQTGIWFTSDKPNNENKVPVYLTNDEGDETGLKMLCVRDSLTIKGFID